MKIFKFSHDEGAEIIAANYAKEAILYYFLKYQDDLNIDDIIEFGGVKIEELQGEAITNEKKIFNEDTNKHESTSYKEIAARSFKGEPVVLVTPNY